MPASRSPSSAARECGCARVGDGCSAVAGLSPSITAALVLPEATYKACRARDGHPAEAEAQTAPPLTRFRLLAESNALASQIVKDFNLGDPRFGLSPQRFRDRSLAVDEVRGTNLLRIRVRLGDPAIATSVCNSLATKLIDLQQQLDLGSAAIMADSLKDQLTQAERKLRTAEDRFEGYNAKAQVELTQEDANARLTQRGALVALLVDIEADRARLRAAEAEIKNYEPILTTPRLVGAEQALGHQRANAEADASRRDLNASAERAERLDDGRVQARADDGAQATPGARGSDSTGSDQDERDARLKRDSQTREEPGVVDTSNPLVNPVYSTLQYEIATTRTKLAGLERRRRELVDVLKIDGAELNRIAQLHQKQLEAARRRTDVDIARRIHGELSMRYRRGAPRRGDQRDDAAARGQGRRARHAGVAEAAAVRGAGPAPGIRLRRDRSRRHGTSFAFTRPCVGMRNRFVLLLDVPLIALSVLGAFVLRFDWLFFSDRREFVPFLVAAILVKPFVFSLFGLYPALLGVHHGARSRRHCGGRVFSVRRARRRDHGRGIDPLAGPVLAVGHSHRSAAHAGAGGGLALLRQVAQRAPRPAPRVTFRSEAQRAHRRRRRRRYGGPA